MPEPRGSHFQQNMPGDSPRTACAPLAEGLLEPDTLHRAASVHRRPQPVGPDFIFRPVRSTDQTNGRTALFLSQHREEIETTHVGQVETDQPDGMLLGQPGA
jgi:hypothetical protein